MWADAYEPLRAPLTARSEDSEKDIFLYKKKNPKGSILAAGCAGAQSEQSDLAVSLALELLH